MKTYVVALIITLILLLMPWWRSLLEPAIVLINKRPEDQFEKLCSFTEREKGWSDSEFWEASGGIRGMFQRIHISWCNLREVQAHSAEGNLDLSDAALLFYMTAGQMTMTFIAIPEAAFTHHHTAALIALEFYCDLVLRTNTLCFSANSQKCPPRLL